MRLKQKLSAMLVVLLILLHSFPAFAIAAYELQEERETVGIQDSGTSSEPSDNQNQPSYVLPEQGASSIERPASPSDAQPPEAPFIELEEQREAPLLSMEPPVLSMEPMEDGAHPGLYGTLDYIPEDTTHITVLFSFSGVDFEPAVNGDDGKDRAWDLSSLSEEDGQPKLTQLCMGVNDLPLKAYQNGEVPSLYIKLEIKRNGEISETEPVKLSHDETLSIPNSPPNFSAKIELTFEGYVLKGTFTDFLPNTARVYPIYSLDGETYEPIGGTSGFMDWDLSRLETNDPDEQVFLQNQTCAYATDEPLQSYLKQGLDRFYIKLQITTVTGDTYDTQAAVIERDTPQPPPENTTIIANFSASMLAVDREQRPFNTYGKYQITVKENATPEDVYALLPDTLPIEVRIVQPGTDEVITSGIVECEVTWKEPTELALTAGEAFTLPDAANELVVPAGTVVSTPLGNYVLSEAAAIDGPYARDEIRIVVNAIGAGEKPDISLTGNMNDDFADDFEPLSLAFRLKPSGATSIKAYSYVEGDKDWTELCELLSRRDVNANQSAEMYGYVDILQPDESPYAEYLRGEITGFLIGIIIEGGTFDGERVILPWPGEYNPPTRIPELDGSGGNENNAGSGGNDSTEEGQRPGLPQEPEQKPEKEPEAPPILPPPVEDVTQTPEPVKPPVPPETIAPEQPQTDTGGMEKPTNAEEAAVAAQPLTSQPPQLREDVPGMSIQKGQTTETPLDQTQSPRTDETIVPAPITSEKEIHTGQQSDNEMEAESNHRSLPMAATAAIALVGGGIAVSVGVGVASGTVSGSSFWGKLLKALRNLSKR